MSRVAILWHLHQPDYRDPASGRPQSPWVRLHALRGYRDLCADIVRDGVACTVNVVPSLLDQLDWYAHGGDDPHAELVQRPADALTAREIAEVRATFVCGHPAMIAASRHYSALAARVRDADPSGRAARLTTAQLRDLQVWSVLAWFGSTARRDFPVLEALRAKGAGFTEDDKAVMIAVTHAIFAEFPGWFAKVARVGCLSTSPYFHPILPLLVNTAHARRCLPHLTDADDAGFAFPDDARLQCVRARERVARITGHAPVGLWPSEGSVSPEVVEIAAAAGFSWLCTDEGVLHKSEGRNATRAGGWDLGHGVIGFFRDRELSDRIGFDGTKHAPGPFAERLIADSVARSKGGIGVIALDGENPWEAHPDAGHALRHALHGVLTRHGGGARSVTLDDAAKEPPVGTVTKLWTGSWIRSDFGIWYGHPDDRKAWRLLADVRRAIEAHPADDPRRAAALERVLPAEGSDWTWWYGDDFDTPFLAAFDSAFRAHLRAAWGALGLPAPVALDHPVSARVFGAGDANVTPPRQVIAPRVESVPAVARWLGAGVLVPRRGAAMAHGEPVIDDIRFGTDANGHLWLWVRFGRDRPAGESWRVLVGDHVFSCVIDTPSRALVLDAGPQRTALAPEGAFADVAIEGADVRVPALGTARLPLPRTWVV